jgi:hypothetical protein
LLKESKMSKDVQSVGVRAEAICGATANTTQSLEHHLERADASITHALAFLDRWLTPRYDGRLDFEASPVDGRFCGALRATLEEAEAFLSDIPEDYGGRADMTEAWVVIGGARELLLAAREHGLQMRAGAALHVLLRTARTYLELAFSLAVAGVAAQKAAQ